MLQKIKYLCIIIIFIHCVQSFLNIDVEYVDERQIGYVNYSYYVTYIEMYYRSSFLEMLVPCDPPYTLLQIAWIPCDLRLYSQICSYPREYDEMDFIKAEDKEGPSFRINYVTGLKHSTYRPFLECANLSMFDFPKDRNTVDYRLNPARMFTEILANSDYYRLTVDLGDRSRMVGFSLFDYYSFYRKGTSDFNNVYTIDTYKIVAVCYSLESEFLFISKKYSICVDYYYGYNCWFYCRDDYRKTCNCESPEYNFAVVCDIQCAEGYLYRLISYLILNEREVIKNCDIVNPCHFITFECERVCLPVTNDSYLCENPTYHFEYVDVETKTILPNNIFFYGRLISIAIDNDSLSKGFFDLSGLINIHFNRDEEVFQSKILQLNFHPTRFIPNSDITDVKFNFTMFFFFYAWDEIDMHTVFFKIYKLAEYAIIKSKYTAEPINLFVCLGDTLECNGSSIPKYRSIYAWRMGSLNISFLMGEEQFIPSSIPLRFYTFSCAIFTIIEDYNTPEVQNTSVGVQIKVFSRFGWNINKDVLKNGFILTCSVEMYVDYELYIQQMEGSTIVNFTKKTNSVIVDKFAGGPYSFICILITINRTLIFSKIIKFILLSDPTFTCIYIFPSAPGTLIQCGHNGNFYDDYEITTRAYLLENKRYIFKVEGRNYLKLPYVVHSNAYYIECRISSSLTHKLFINSTDGFTFSEGLMDIIKLDYRNQICSNFYPYIEYPPIISSTDEYVEVIIYGIQLQIKEFNENIGITTRILIIFLIPILLIFWILLFYEENKVTKKQFLFDIFHIRRTLIRVMIHNRLNAEVKRAIDKKSGSLAKFYRASFLDKFTTSSTTLSAL